MFGKVFASLWEGSMVAKPDLQLVFIYMLARCNADGVLDQTQEVIAAFTGLPIERVREAVTQLEAPDQRSRTPDSEGRRIERLDEHRDWGWRIVNYRKYRSMLNEDQRRSEARDRMRQKRASEKCELFADVRSRSQPFAQADVEVEEKKKVVVVDQSYAESTKSTPAARGLSRQPLDTTATERATCHNCHRGYLRPQGSKRVVCQDCHGDGAR